MNHPKSWLRYVDANAFENTSVNIDGATVRSGSGDELGKIDGLIVDSAWDSGSGRAYYVVVDAGGWFKSRHFLVPIGQLYRGQDNRTFVVKLTREQINRFPGFDTDEFDDLTETDFKVINDGICSIFEPGVSYAADEPYSAAWNRLSYKSPDWWNAAPVLPERMGASAYEKPVEYPPAPAARDRARDEPGRPRGNGVRATPGEVLGVDTGGEQTHLGETEEDEDRRREEGEQANHRHQ